MDRTILDPTDTFVRRHVGPRDADVAEMLARVGSPSMAAFIDSVVPDDIRLDRPLRIGPPRGERELLEELLRTLSANAVYRSCIGMGYVDVVTPPVVLRNVLENPGWYTQYTPYQAEISQGRLEALLNFQTLVSDLTGLPLANASLLDEGTAAAEAVSMCVQIAKGGRRRVLVGDDCHPQTIGVIQTRGASMGVQIDVCRVADTELGDDVAGVVLAYPTTDGRFEDHAGLARRVHDAGGLVVAVTDLLACCLLRPPGEWGADICVGSAQRFGVPMGLGGPHAAFMSTRDAYVRKLAGRLVGVSRDAAGRPALRLAVQTREQHIKRDRATSNICTAQVLLAIMASMYAVYHGPDGLRAIARRIRAHTELLARAVAGLGHAVADGVRFDTVRVRVRPRAGLASVAELHALADRKRINLRDFGDGSVGVTLDETVDERLLADLAWCFAGGRDVELDPAESIELDDPEPFARTSDFLTNPVFNTHHSETEMLRYLTTLQSRDLSLAHSMIPLGSCTMKLNGTSEMVPVTWPEVARLHPFAPREQWSGYRAMLDELERWLCEITGFSAVSLMPNAGSQGEYTGLLVIRAYHRSRGDDRRDVCLIPESAHGTNPASAVIAGMRVVPVRVDERGAISLDDLRAKAERHRDELAACMITYPSTAGVFDLEIRAMCAIVHEFGGQVYLDGANMNAQVGLARPGDYGADVCHLNLHKTFCIPHGGGGPGMGPIGVASHLRPFLPGHPVVQPASAGDQGVGPVAAAPYGSASILPISWVYIALMGSEGLRHASEVAVLSANYMAERLKDDYAILFRSRTGRVAHEFVIDCRPFKKSAGVEIDDIAKRLIDYGFHAPTMSWPVPGTLMIEPTESESKAEIDRFCDALISIRAEIAKIEAGTWTRADNPLKGAPHTIEDVAGDSWARGYSRTEAAYPAPHLRQSKFWSSVARVDNPYGDRNLVCTCPAVTEV